MTGTTKDQLIDPPPRMNGYYRWVSPDFEANRARLWWLSKMLKSASVGKMDDFCEILRIATTYHGHLSFIIDQDEERRCREAARFHSNEMLEKVPEILLRSEAEERRVLAKENKEAVERRRDELKADMEFKRLQVTRQPRSIMVHVYTVHGCVNLNQKFCVHRSHSSTLPQTPTYPHTNTHAHTQIAVGGTRSFTRGKGRIVQPGIAARSGVGENGGGLREGRTRSPRNPPGVKWDFETTLWQPMVSVVQSSPLEYRIHFNPTDLRRHEREMREIESRHATIFREYRQSCENQKVRLRLIHPISHSSLMTKTSRWTTWIVVHTSIIFFFITWCPSVTDGRRQSVSSSSRRSHPRCSVFVGTKRRIEARELEAKKRIK